MSEPLPKHEVVQKDGYTLTFYPGFLRRADVASGDRRVVLYEQRDSYDVRDQPDERPLTRYELRLQGGPDGRDLTLHVNDPQRSVAEIVVRFHPARYPSGKGNAPPPTETLSMWNDAILCPPLCPFPPPP